MPNDIERARQKRNNKCVHTEHCCKECGCKYGEDDYCPVVNGRKKQSQPCGTAYTCRWDDES